MSGLELLRHFRQASPDTAVILMTAYRVQGDGDRGAQRRCDLLRGEAVRPGRDQGGRPQDARAEAHRERERRPQGPESGPSRAAPRSVQLRRARGAQREDASDLPAGRAGGRDREHDHDLGGVGHREGAHREGDPLQLRPGRPGVRLDQLRRSPRRAPGERAVRTHARLVHRCHGQQEGAVRGRERRHDLPGRDRRDVGGDADQAPARSPGEADPARRRDRGDRRGRPGDHGDEPGARARWSARSASGRTSTTGST